MIVRRIRYANDQKAEKNLKIVLLKIVASKQSQNVKVKSELIY